MFVPCFYGEPAGFAKLFFSLLYWYYQNTNKNTPELLIRQGALSEYYPPQVFFPEAQYFQHSFPGGELITPRYRGNQVCMQFEYLRYTVVAE